MTPSGFSRTVRAVEVVLRAQGVPVKQRSKVSGVVDDAVAKAKGLVRDAKAWIRKHSQVPADLKGSHERLQATRKRLAARVKRVREQMGRLSKAASKAATTIKNLPAKTVDALQAVAREAWQLSVGPVAIALLAYLWLKSR